MYSVIATCPDRGLKTDDGEEKKNRFGRVSSTDGTGRWGGDVGVGREAAVAREEVAWPEDTRWRDTGTGVPIGRGIVGVHAHAGRANRTYKRTAPRREYLPSTTRTLSRGFVLVLVFLRFFFFSIFSMVSSAAAISAAGRVPTGGEWRRYRTMHTTTTLLRLWRQRRWSQGQYYDYYDNTAFTIILYARYVNCRWRTGRRAQQSIDDGIIITAVPYVLRPKREDTGLRVATCVRIKHFSTLPYKSCVPEHATPSAVDVFTYLFTE